MGGENVRDRFETWALSLVGTGALLGVALSIYGVISAAVSVATATSVRVDRIPVSDSEYPSFLVASDAPVDARYESAWVEIANLPGYARFLLWAEDALPTVAGLVICVAAAWLALALLRGDPFSARLPVMLGITAVVVIVTGLGAQGVSVMARTEVIAFLGAPGLVAGSSGYLVDSSVLDPAPLGWGLGIALVAAAFSIGTRLQRDTRNPV